MSEFHLSPAQYESECAVTSPHICPYLPRCAHCLSRCKYQTCLCSLMKLCCVRSKILWHNSFTMNMMSRLLRNTWQRVNDIDLFASLPMLPVCRSLFHSPLLSALFFHAPAQVPEPVRQRVWDRVDTPGRFPNAAVCSTASCFHSIRS